MGRRFELRINHCGLKYLFDHPTLNARKARWLEFLCEFDFEIKHIKGKSNKVVGALSRKFPKMHVTSHCAERRSTAQYGEILSRDVT